MNVSFWGATATVNHHYNVRYDKHTYRSVLLCQVKVVKYKQNWKGLKYDGRKSHTESEVVIYNPVTSYAYFAV